MLIKCRKRLMKIRIRVRARARVVAIRMRGWLRRVLREVASHLCSISLRNSKS